MVLENNVMVLEKQCHGVRKQCHVAIVLTCIKPRCNGLNVKLKVCFSGLAGKPQNILNAGVSLLISKMI